VDENEIMIDLDVISSPVYHDLLTLIDSFATAANGKKRSSSSGGAGGAGGDSLAAIKKRKAV
jgi:uncharacterized membrane protein